MMAWSRLPTSALCGPERPELRAHARLALAIHERHEEVLHVGLDLVHPLHGDTARREIFSDPRDPELAALLSPAVRAACERAGVELRHYA